MFGTFRGKGTYEFDDASEPVGGPMASTTCRLTFQSKLVQATRPPPDPPFMFYGNQVAHCDNGSMIHGRIFGPTGPGSAPRGFDQTVTGTLNN